MDSPTDSPKVVKEREKSPIHEAYAEGQSIGAKVMLGTDRPWAVEHWGK